MLEEDATSGLVRQIRREARSNPLVAGQLLDCAVQLSAKAPVYALLVGEWRWGGLERCSSAAGWGRMVDMRLRL